MALDHAAAMLDGMMTMTESLEVADRKEAAKKHFSTASSLLEQLPGLDDNAGKMLNSKIESAKFWSESEQKSLQEIVNKKMSAAIVCLAPAARLRTQDYTSLVEYLPASLCAKLCDSTLAFPVRSELLCGFAKALGLICPSEPTYAHLLSIMHTCSPPQYEMTSQQKFEVLKSFKVTVKKIIDKEDKARVGQTAYITKLPSTPAEFSDHPCYKSAFQTDAPHPSPSRSTQVIAYARSIPLRCTNFSSYVPLQRASVPEEGMAAMCAMFMRAMAPQPDGSLRIFSSPQPSNAVQHPQLIMQPAGLQNSLQRHQPAAPTSESSGSVNSPSMLALTDQKDEDEVNKGNDVDNEKTDVDNEKTEAKVSPLVTKSAGITSRVDPLKLIEELQDKRKAAAAQAVMKRPAAQTEKKQAQGSNKKKRAQAATQTQKLQKAAVASQANQKPPPKKTKAPASNSKKKKSSADTSGMSMHSRLLLRPNGCPKCRRKPGCTPSCLRGVINGCCCFVFCFIAPDYKLKTFHLTPIVSGKSFTS